MTDCRFAEWNELLLHEEWRNSIPKEVAFRGWQRLDKIGERIDAFEDRPIKPKTAPQAGFSYKRRFA